MGWDMNEGSSLSPASFDSLIGVGLIDRETDDRGLHTVLVDRAQ